MAIRDIEGFDTVNNVVELGEIHGSFSGDPNVNFGFGRNTSAPNNRALGLRGNLLNPNKLFFGPYNATSYEYWTIGIAIKASFLNPSTTYSLFDFVNSSGQTLLSLKAITGTTPTLITLRVSVGITNYNTPVEYSFDTKAFKFLEFQVRFNASGQFDLKLDEQSILSQTGINTIATSGTGHRLVLVGDMLVINTNPILPPQITYDDLYIKTGTSLESFLGNVVVLGLYPTFDALKQWNAINGANFQNLDDPLTSDGDKSFISALDDLKEDRYLMQVIPSIYGNPLGIQYHGRLRVITQDTRTFKFRYENSGTAVGAAATHTLDSLTYEEFRELLELNPATNSPWTLSDAINGEFGFRLET